MVGYIHKSFSFHLANIKNFNTKFPTSFSTFIKKKVTLFKTMWYLRFLLFFFLQLLNLFIETNMLE